MILLTPLDPLTSLKKAEEVCVFAIFFDDSYVPPVSPDPAKQSYLLSAVQGYWAIGGQHLSWNLQLLRNDKVKREQKEVSDLAPAFRYVNATILKAATPMDVRHRKSGQHQRLQRSFGDTEFNEVVEYFISSIAALRNTKYKQSDPDHLLSNDEIWDTVKSTNGLYKQKDKPEDTVYPIASRSVSCSSAS